uniref:N-Carbamoyl-L-cysteine amidohydrolase n=1 Tax=Pseudomonas sp. ON4a TaxID=100476 RepID=Q9FB05_9PSED|nr:N-Carbamoyl-L-cysteine amidohydrolase [Pseudomonas sp. ON4a]
MNERSRHEHAAPHAGAEAPGREHTALRVNGARLWDSLERMARIGATQKGGVCRLALTELDREGRDLFVQWAREAGCTIRVDQMGNVFARRGRNPDAAPVLTGSHADTQPTGGRYDGIYGVLGGLEVIRTLNDAGVRTEHPVEAVIWTNEEGSRFARDDLVGRLCGRVPARIRALAHRRHGYDDRRGARADRLRGRRAGRRHAVHAAYELHIEQGAILERSGKTIGVVTAGQGQRWYEIELVGVDAHAGTTPMDLRRDALAGGAHDYVRRGAGAPIRAAWARHGRHDRGEAQLAQHVPGRCFFTVEFRHPDAGVLAELDRNCALSWPRGAGGAARAHDRADLRLCAGAVRASMHRPVGAAVMLDLPHDDIVSGAGHDACYLACRAHGHDFRAVRRRVESQRGRAITPEWAEAGANVLLQVMLESALMGGRESMGGG